MYFNFSRQFNAIPVQLETLGDIKYGADDQVEEGGGNLLKIVPFSSHAHLWKKK